MKIVSVREHPEFADAAGPLPQWYLLMSGGEPAGCAGLIANDFISRMDLCPWACALYVAEHMRGHAYGRLLLDRAAEDARRAGFGKLYLSTDHAGLYEKWGFRYIGQGYHPWDAESRIYERTL